MSANMQLDTSITFAEGNTLLRQVRRYVLACTVCADAALSFQLSTRPSAKGGMLFDNPTFTAAARRPPRWYVGPKTRGEAEAHLLQASDPQAGDFVVRESSANGNFVVSILLDRNTFEHHQLTQDAQVGN